MDGRDIGEGIARAFAVVIAIAALGGLIVGGGVAALIFWLTR